MPPEFTHLDPLGRARMVDVTAKEPSHRRAVARCRVHMEAETASAIAAGAISKGDVLAVAATYLFGRINAREIGGRTGDTLGACQQIAAIAFLIGLAAF